MRQYWVIFWVMIGFLVTAIGLTVFLPVRSEGPCQEEPPCWLEGEIPSQVKAGQGFSVTLWIQPWYPQPPQVVTVTVVNDEGVCFGEAQIASRGGTVILTGTAPLIPGYHTLTASAKKVRMVDVAGGSKGTTKFHRLILG